MRRALKADVFLHRKTVISSYCEGAVAVAGGISIAMAAFSATASHNNSSMHGTVLHFNTCQGCLSK